MLVRGSTLNLSRIGVHIGPGPHWGQAELKNESELNWLEKASFLLLRKKDLHLDRQQCFLFGLISVFEG